jgi:hypothetical protein
MCNAVSMKKCGKDPGRHGSNFASCSSCHAAKIGYCHNHCGVAKAIGEHTKAHDIDPKLAKPFELVGAAISAYAASLPKDVKNVYVKAIADQDQPNAPFAKVRLEIVATK